MEEDKAIRVSAEVLRLRIRKMLECCKIKEQNIDKLPELFL
jgi:hypothetical protein